MNGQGGTTVSVTNGNSIGGGFHNEGHRSSHSERRPGRTFPHIHDLNRKASDLGVDRKTPLPKLVQTAESALNYSKNSIEFRRPDIAYVEYLKASEIAVNIIPRHPDYYEYRSRPEWANRNRALVKDITRQQNVADDIKRMILEDNARSGVQPTLPIVADYSMPPSRPSSSSSYGIPTPTSSPPPSGPDTLPLPRHQVKSADLESPPSFHRNPSPGQSPRMRPIVRPKPEGLHGNAMGGATSSVQDPLAQRFAKLRIAQPPSMQDQGARNNSPRANGHVSMPSPTDFMPNSRPWSASANQTDFQESNSPASRPSGPRDMPSKLNPAPQLPPKIPLDTSTGASLPKAPSPTYSPVTSLPVHPSFNSPRTPTDNMGGTARQSSQMSLSSDSATRADSPLKRTALSNSTSSVPSHDRLHNASAANGDRHYQTPRSLYDYHTYASTSTTSLSNVRSSKPRTIDLPVDGIITADKLFDCIKQYHVLLIDVRSRDQFDQGHIFSKSIMCIEPLSLRDGLSADELEESLVLSPDQEQTLFEQRDEFDLVVFYDQKSTSVSDSSALRALFDTLYEFNYAKVLKDGRPPVLLYAGLDAWVDLVGNQALQASKTAVILGTTRIRPIRRQPARLGRQQTVNANSSLEIRRRRLRAHKPMTDREQEEWLQKAKQEEIDPSRYSQAPEEEKAEAEIPTPSSLAHTYEDFFRRFPEASDVQQSMIMPTPPPTQQQQYPQQQHPQQQPPPIMPASHPQVPSRPAPAVPRPSYHGTSDNTSAQLALSRQTSAQRPPLYFPAVQTRRRLPLTGMVNYGVTCYMNATMQCLNATLPLTTYFLNDQWKYDVQKHNRGSSGNLLPFNYANLIRALWVPGTEAVGPKTFRDFFRRQSGTEISEDRQHDAKEFLDLVLDYLHSDMNRHHARSILEGLTAEQERIRESMPVDKVSDIEWSRYIHRDFSLISGLFAGQHSSRLRCLTCKTTSTIYETFFSLSVELPDPRRASRTDIHACLNSYFREEVLEHPWHCPTCKTDRRATKKLTLTRLPRLLIVHFKRFIKSPDGRSHKLHTEVDFPLYNLDLEAYMIPRSSTTSSLVNANQSSSAMISSGGNSSANESDRADPAITPPFSFNAYGVIRHLGTRTDSGHYIALVKDATVGKWFKFDDDNVREVDIERLSPRQRLQNDEAYIVFYERSAPR